MSKGLHLSDEAKELRREYGRQWRKKNRDKVKAAQERYWEKKAQREEVAENEGR